MALVSIYVRCKDCYLCWVCFFICCLFFFISVCWCCLVQFLRLSKTLFLRTVSVLFIPEFCVSLKTFGRHRKKWLMSWLVWCSLFIWSVWSWRHDSHIGVSKQWNGGHVVVTNQSCRGLQSTRFTHERTTSNIHKIFHSPIWFFNYEMILRTFNCTIVNQIKSSKKLVVKLKIRNLQL